MAEDTTRKFEKKSFANLLTSTPPGATYEVDDFTYIDSRKLLRISTPELQMYCNSKTCQRYGFFDIDSFPDTYPSVGLQNLFFVYKCRNCKSSSKTFAVTAICSSTDQPSLVIKIGERPAFGAATPARLISLIGPDKDYFLQGRRAENLGLGIGAFAYYRRVVENQKGRLIREIAKVVKRLGADETILQQFEKAANETQFDRAINDVKGAIPQSLLIRGHNPLKLLHSALSEGIHAQSDAECLDIATSIRVVLAELADRITTALKEEAELTSAVNRLLQPANQTPLSLPSKGENEKSGESKNNE
jgi:hypothetical protein